LLAQGIDLRCVSVGWQEAQLWDESFADDGCVLLAPDEHNIKKQAQAFASWCEVNAVDIVMGVNSVAIISSLVHLSEEIRILSRCANAFDHGYQITICAYERLSQIIALAPRQIEDLVTDYGVERSRITLIPNGASVARFSDASRQPRGTSEIIRLGYLGRLEHSQKGILHLPGILKRLNEKDIFFSLSIAGKGVHEAALRRELNSFVRSGEVEFVGALGPDEIADYLRGIDVFVFPSHFEGSPNALIEAMMSGCVPAAWRLEGITDFLIEDNISGVLAETGDCQELADKVAGLAKDRERLQVISEKASKIARDQFSLERVVTDYTRLIQGVMTKPPGPIQVKSWKHFQVEPVFYRPVWRRLIPAWLKKACRRALFILHFSDRYE